MEKIRQYVNEMTIEEKAALLAGTEFWKTNPIPRHGIGSIYMTDGPCGLRKQGDKADHLGINESDPTTSFPTGVSIASSWNLENARLMGQAIAEECKAYGVNVLLGPAVNIKKNPRCGRNFEYFSEDPLISGKMGIEFTKGVQSEGIGVSVKHFAANSNENYRFMGDSIVDDRALREIYLKAFEMIVKEANPSTVMCAYNKVNGTYCSENKYLLTDILRKEWGYDGVVLSDWGAVNDRVESLKAGMDLEMPGDCTYFRKNIIDAALNGKLSMEYVDRAATNVLKLIERTKGIKKTKHFAEEEHSRLSGEIAADSAVLLKNNGGLPLKRDEKYLIIGDLFDKMRYQGAGSSLINPTKVTSPKNAFDQRKVKYTFVRGYRESEVEPEINYENEAVKAAEEYDQLLFFLGQTDYTESEGYDRDHLELPANQVSLLNRLIKMEKKIILVLYGGSPVEMPFESKVNAILNMYLPGQTGGEATAALLFGEKTPSGKLAETWPMTYQEVPFGNEYISSKSELYKESIYVGYRYYDKVKGKGVRYPFGFGLSYTSFEYTNLVIEVLENDIQICCDVQNTGECFGAEIVQLYVGNPQGKVFMAEKELRAFSKAYLQPGEKKTVNMSFLKSDLAYYNICEKNWILENGTYMISVGASSTDLRLESKIEISGEAEVENPYSRQEFLEYYDVANLSKVTDKTFEKLLGYPLPNRKEQEIPVHLNTRFVEFRYSFIGRILYNAIVGVGERQFKKALKMPDGPEREAQKKTGMFVMRLMPNNSVRSLSASSAGVFPMKLAYAFVELTNGHILKGLKYILQKEKASKLPKDMGKKKEKL